MKIAFRVDASTMIGSGHVMRCLTLADMLKKRGHQVCFICRKLPGNFIYYIQEYGFEVIKLNYQKKDFQSQKSKDVYFQFLSVEMEKEIEQSKKIIKKLRPDWLVIDHYALNKDWENVMKSFSKKIMVIDDLANREHGCDLLLDQNIQLNTNRYQAFVPSACELLLGTQYFLLRPEFIKFSQQSMQKKRNTLQHIFIFFGGSDVQNATEKTIQAILKSSFSGTVDIVLGKNNENSGRIKNLFSAYASLLFYDDVKNMAELMSQADLCIGAGGATSWERCFLGLPSLIITIAENQRTIAQVLDTLNAAKYLGDIKDISLEAIISAINGIVLSPLILNKLSVNAKKLVDGMGVEKVVNTMETFFLLRKAAKEDVVSIFHLRNHPLVRINSFSTDELTFVDHQFWFYQSLKNIDRQILVAKNLYNKLIGVVRFDFFQHYAEVSIYIDPEEHGKGYGFKVLNKALQWISKNSRCQYVIAKVKPENIASHKLFLKAGFVEKQTHYEKILG